MSYLNLSFLRANNFRQKSSPSIFLKNSKNFSISQSAHYQESKNWSEDLTKTRKPTVVKRKVSRPLIGRFNEVFPIELARVQSGKIVNLRDYETQVKLNRLSFDLKTYDGMVLPAEGPNFIGPNGSSLREPFSPTFQEVVRNFRGTNITVFIIPEGIPIPKTLTLLHEHSDHFSLQCSKPMTLPELNKEITEFLRDHARAITKEEFVEEYPYEI